MAACWFRAHQAERPKYFPLGLHRCCSLALDKSPRECFVKNKNGSCLTASSMMLTNPCVIKERESHRKLKPAARPPGRGVRWLGSGTSDSCSSAERLCALLLLSARPSAAGLRRVGRRCPPRSLIIACAPNVHPTHLHRTSSARTATMIR